MKWHVITGEADLDALREHFSGFHDACLREVHVWRDIFVDEEGIMHNAAQAGTHARLLFQRQDLDGPQAIELWFDEVRHVQVVQIPFDDDQFMSAATLIREGDVYYWADAPDWTPNAAVPLAREAGAGYAQGSPMWVGARQLRWRDVPDWLGNTLRYGAASK